MYNQGKLSSESFLVLILKLKFEYDLLDYMLIESLSLFIINFHIYNSQSQP